MNRSSTPAGLKPAPETGTLDPPRQSLDNSGRGSGQQRITSSTSSQLPSAENAPLTSSISSLASTPPTRSAPFIRAVPYLSQQPTSPPATSAAGLASRRTPRSHESSGTQSSRPHGFTAVDPEVASYPPSPLLPALSSSGSKSMTTPNVSSSHPPSGPFRPSSSTTAPALGSVPETAPPEYDSHLSTRTALLPEPPVGIQSQVSVQSPITVNHTMQQLSSPRNVTTMISQPDALLPITTASNGAENSLEIRGIAGVRVPGRPKFFFGRDTAANRLVDMALDQSDGNARIVIKGPPGIGKTTLAIAVLTDNRVKNAFGSSRIFIRCAEFQEEDRSVHGLLRNLALKLRLTDGGDLFEKVDSLLKTLRRSIVVLDGLEAIWGSGDSRAEVEVERFLDLLSDIDEVVLVVTVRGRSIPQTIPWSNRLDDSLLPLSPADARKTFLKRTDCKQAHDTAEASDLEALLAEVDHHPQAVVLLARLGDPPSKLLREWNDYDKGPAEGRTKGRTEIIEADDHDGTEPELSMCVSIMLSIRLLDKDNSRPALDLLKICQDSLDGLTEERQEELRLQIPRFDRQRRRLERPGLVQPGALTMLSTIRHFNLPQ